MTTTIARKYVKFVPVHIITKSKPPELMKGEEKIIEYSNGTEVEVIGRDYSFYKVEILKDKVIGFVYIKYVVFGGKMNPQDKLLLISRTREEILEMLLDFTIGESKSARAQVKIFQILFFISLAVIAFLLVSRAL